ncbi:hypothetical protein CASFOL_005575 [Castilleja foliolosa]|uniref:Uncharacterized protein n=1 Tax=Castilleja foliolosa TaxID=1961234 RepID=A0ABD3E517_9LAMI
MSSRGGNSRRADKGKAVALDQSDEFVPVSPFFDGGGDGDFSIGRQWSRDEIIHEFEADDDVQPDDDVPGEDDDMTAPPPTTQGSY